MASNEDKLLDYLKRVTADLRKTQRRLKDVESAGHEPIAIVGMACRFPGGVRSPEELWDLVARDQDAITGFPTDRNWDLDHLFDPDPENPGTCYTREGGFVDDVAGFDAPFFGISPREALGMAPQQRLALEASWEAIEHAGIDPDSLRGSRTATFIGCDHLDYYSDASQVPEGSAGYFTIGNTASVVSGRVAYTLGLEGAAVTVDTACSSASVAMHLACQSLRQEESTLALAGGVAVISSTGPFVGFADLRALAPDGRSKAFSANADGMTMSEGVGVLLLERLSDARRNGHQVLAVIRGSAINQDGTSNGLTAPNGPAQQRVITQALADARLAPAEVDAVEAHGTGTSLGDPIEAQALLATYGRDRPEDRPLWLGSIKSNIGHAQMAAGAAGVIKMVMAMRHGVLPATLHVDEPTPHVDWDSGAVRLLTGQAEWRRADRPRRAGVSSFGISGTNAHVILEEAPEPEPSGETGEAPEGGVVPWVLSGRTADALRGQAQRLAERLSGEDATAEDVGWSLATTRSRFEHRAVVVGEDRDELLTGLAELARGRAHPAVVAPGTATVEPGKTVFLFSGQGSQRVGMGAGLYARFPVFAAAFDEVCALLDPHLEYPLRTVVFDGGPQAGLLDHTTYAQAGLFALQVGLARLLESVGVRPEAVVGHSIGEIAAAHIAGVFDLPDACRLVAARATLMGGLPTGGAMAAIEANATELTDDLGEGVSIAALNTPTSTVISGPAEHITRITADWAAKGRKTKTLTVSHAFHSPQMDPILTTFKDAISDLTYHTPTIPLISNLTGLPADEHITTPGYWSDHIAQPVHFHPAITHLATNTKAFLELGPDPVLTTATQHTLNDTNPLTVSALTTKRPDVQALTHALARLHTTGVDVDWSGWFDREKRTPRAVALPTYAFQHQRYWLAPPSRPDLDGDEPGAAESRLWNAIEELDVDALTAALRLDGDSEAIDLLRPALPVLSTWRRQNRERSLLDSWRYQVTWKPVSGSATAALSGTWLVLVPADRVEDPAALVAVRALHDHGADARVLPVHTAEAGREVLARLIADETGDAAPAGVISLLALDAEPLPAFPAVPAGLAATTAAIQSLGDAGVTAPLWCLTQGAVATAATEPLPDPVQAQVWGLGRVAALEHPERWGGLIDLPVAVDDRAASRLAALLVPGQAEDQSAIRASGTLVRRLRNAPAPRTAEEPWRPEGTTLITGGTGGLGAHLARRLAENGAPHLLLASRGGPDSPGAERLAEELTALGSTVTIAACDVADRDAVEGLLDQVPAEHPLTAVIHAAGTADIGPIAELDPERLEHALRSKAHAAAHLHELTRDLDLTAFVLFSSNAATWGSGQQGAYAAANTYLDALAEHRRAQGLPATSVAWGPWGEIGMAADETTLTYLKRRGLSPLDPEPAVKSLYLALDDATVTIADVDWTKFPATFTAQRPSPFLSDLARMERPDDTATAAHGHPLHQELGGAGPAQQLQILLRHVRTQAAAVLGHPDPEAIPPGRPFQELGFDSLTAVELRNQLTTITGRNLPPTLIFDHPTPNALAKYLRAELTGHRASAATAVTTAAADEPIAIVGMACRFPGGVRSPEELWDLVTAERDAIADLPADRGWDLEKVFDPDPDHLGTSYVREGGFLYDAAEFDASFFGISPREALAMDPQQRLLLETAWETFENAGLDRTALSGSSTGVFTGGTFQGYGAGTSSSAREVEGYLLAGGTPSVMSGRLSYTFGLEGPAVTVDTACSSALVAMHLAAQALRQGECTMALAGGVAVMATPTTFIEFSRQRGLAADGRCKPFAAAADGTGWGEGAGLLLLERLSDARRNGHRVLAVMRGSAVNQDGTSNGLTAPNGPSQQRVIAQALANARLTTDDVDAIEAHGTGTTLGDPIEAQALLATYGQGRPDDRPLWIGSVKSNIGHTQAAAGAAGVIKMVMAMRHGVLPSSLHVDAPSPHVDWDSGAVRLLTERVGWPEAERPRRAGVSSFGISGTNAHVILEQAPEPAEPEPAPDTADDGGVLPWVLSARGDEALRGQAAALAARLASGAPPVADVGWSLVRSRSSFERRAVVIGADPDQMLAGVRALATGDTHPDLVRADTAEAVTGENVWLFSGQGSQRPGMGAGLYDRFPVFAAAFDEVCELLDPHLEHSLRQVMWDEVPDRPGLLDHTTYAQAGLFALQVALARLLASAGIEPDVVIGHSIGEVAAAHVAGVFDLADACRLVAARATLMGGLPSGGAMTAIQAAPDELAADIEASGGQVSIAALNTPDSTVISGPDDLVAAIGSAWADKGRKTKRLTVSHAFHSPLMDPILEDFGRAIGDLTYNRPAIPLISNLTGLPADELIATPDYWVRHIRQPVRFQPAIAHTAPRAGLYLELGPDPVLATTAQHTLHHSPADAPAGEEPANERPAPLVAATLTGKRPEVQALTHTLARLHANGVDVDWTGWFPADPAPRVVRLPTYAFQRRRYWLAPDAEGATATGEEPGDTRFWDAVEREDLEALARTLDSPPDQRPMLDALLPTLSAWRRRRGERSVLDSWRHQAGWTHLPEAAAPVLSGSWLVFVPAGDTENPGVDIAVRALRDHGATALPQHVETATADRDALAARLSELTAENEVEGVLNLLPMDQAAHPGHPAIPAGLAATIALLQALGDAGVTAPLWCLTQGAVSVSPTDPLPHPAQAQTWGLGRVAALEHPQRWGGLVDLPTALDPNTPGRLAALLAPGQPEDQVAIRATGAFARRLRHAPASPSGDGWRPYGTTLVTGGTGDLGARVARWLAENGAPHLLLTSRSGPDAPGADQLTHELTELGSAVTITACDVSDRAALEDLLGTVPAEHPLTAVIHAAGIPEAMPLPELSLAHLGEVLLPKAHAAAHLHELTRDLDLSAFVMFSSGAAAWGSGQQASYAMANTYLDALAEHRRTLGLPATSIAWGPWGDTGMAADDTAVTYYGHLGLTPLDPGLAIKSLQRALDQGDTTVTVADIDWARFAAAFTTQRPSPLIADLAGAGEETAEDQESADADHPLRRELSGGTPAQQHHLLLRLVQTRAASILGHSGPDAVPSGQPFQELGFDSLTSVELRNQLSAATGLNLPPTLVFDQPTPGVLATYLRDELTGQRSSVSGHSSAVGANDEPIAIVGMACRFPGDTRSPEDLWDLVAARGDAIAEMPTNRDWDLNLLFNPDPDHPGTSYVREGGFLYDAAEFDASFFGISPREALAMDPQQRVLLETAWETFENAGLRRDALKGSNTGIFTGVTSQDYLSLTTGTPSDVEGYVATGNIGSVVSGRVAYTFGLEGPAVTVDTACSSSLVATHLACQALRQGECTMALAGGVTVMATPGAFVEFSRQRGMAADARCKAFAASADGLTWGEGAGLILLERLSDAQKNGHQVLAVIRGSATNQDGASNGLTAPNGPSQQRVIRQALANAGLSAAEVDVVEAHGTGTALGDPIEAQALLATYGKERSGDEPLWLGSVKSNIGHTQAAAGVAGVIKMVMAMRHETLPATLYADEPTPNVDWDSGAVRLLGEPVEWPRGERPRRAGVSAFGISGTNAHLLLEQAPEPATASADDVSPGGVVPWAVSARSDQALHAQAAALAAHLAAAPDASPSDVGWSLLTNRSAFEHRAVVVGEDRAELLAGLEALGRGEAHTSVVSPGTPAVASDAGPVLVFPGQGSQWAGMGAGLLDSSPVFADRLAECEWALSPYVDWSVGDVLRGWEGSADLSQVDVVQPALWATMVSLAAVWADLGVVPAAVVGHSQGEIAAACVAGALSLEDGARIVALRSQALRRLAGGGAMASLGMSREQAADLLAREATDVVVASINGPSSTVVSGPPDQVAAVVAKAEADGLRARTIDVNYASHSPQVDEIAGELTELLTGILPFDGDVAFYSTVTAAPIDTLELDAGYWVTNLREPVRFADTIQALIDDGHRVFIEASSHPVLTIGMQETFEAAGVAAATVPTLTRDHGDHAQLVRAVAQAFAAGVQVDWTAVFPGERTARPVPLPTYAFQRRRYWVEPAVRPGGGRAGEDPAETRLWHAIEELDVESLATTLRLDDDGQAVDDLRPALPILSAWRRRHREQTLLDSWRYRATWTHLSDPAAATTLSGTWLLAVPAGQDEHPTVRAVAEALNEHGATALVLPVDILRADRDELAMRLSDQLIDGSPAGVLSLLAVDEAPHPDHPVVPAGLAASIALVQAMGDAGIAAPLWCVTQGAVSVSPTDPLPSPVQAQTWGMGRVAALEHSDRWGGLIDLPADLDHHAPARLAALLAPGQPEDQTAIRTTATFARRLQRAPAISANGAAVWRPEGTTLVTGGTSGLGARVARWLAENGAPHLLLTSRSGPDAPGADELARELTELGSAVTITACDVSDRAALEDLLGGIPAEHPLAAVVHAAGVPENAAFTDLDLPHVNEVLRPKAHAAAHLHELTRDLDLSAFVMFSSGAAAWGSGLQASYAAANTYLDALAEHRRTLGLPATSIAWGPWGDTGMAADDTAVAFFGRRGLTPMDPGLAIKSLHHALSHGDTTITVADIDWTKFSAAFTTQRPSRLIADLAETVREDPGHQAPAADEHPLRQQLAAGTPAERRTILLRHVQTHVAAVLGHADPGTIPPAQPFQELGFDSLTAVELRNQLNATTGLSLPPTLIFDHPSPGALADLLGQHLIDTDVMSEGRVLSDLDQWDSACEPAAMDEAARRRVTQRLELLLAKWSDAGGGGSTAHRDLEAATADDIFDLISDEFGKS